MTKKAKNPLGIVAYGAKIPSFKMSTSAIAEGRGKEPGAARSLGVLAKTVPQLDEDSITLATAAAEQALERFELVAGKKEKIACLFIGSESHPYAVKPSGATLQMTLGLSNTMAMADLQFACKAGTQAVQIAAQYIASTQADYALAIGADTAQAKPGDALEYTAAAGAAAFILGQEKVLAKLLATVSVASDTPDFWRKPGEAYPQHAGRFTGEPAYFKHVMMATKLLLKKEKLNPEQIDFCVFHTPNAKFPEQAAKRLGFSKEQLAESLIVKEIGNTYAAASLLALVAVLDQAKSGQKILLTSYGSGSGADSFLFETTTELVKQRKSWHRFLSQEISNLKELDFNQFQALASQRQH